MPTISLDQLRADVEKTYGPFIVELGGGATATLLPMLRLPAELRGAFNEKYKRVQALQSDPTVGLDDLEAALRELLATVAKPDGSAERLLAVLPEGDTAMAMELFRQYADAGQPGEASASPS